MDRFFDKSFDRLFLPKSQTKEKVSYPQCEGDNRIILMSRFQAFDEQKHTSESIAAPGITTNIAMSTPASNSTNTIPSSDPSSTPPTLSSITASTASQPHKQNTKRKAKLAMSYGSDAAGGRYVDDPSKLVDVDKPEPKGKGGRKPDAMLESLTRKCYYIPDGEDIELYRCVGGGEGDRCGYVWTNRGTDRVSKHALKCKKLQNSQTSESKSNRKFLVNYAITTAPSARLETKTTGPTAGAESSGDGAVALKAVGDEKTGENPWFKEGREKGMKKKHLKMDLAILKLLCVAGLPTHLVDYDEWTELLNIADPSYEPATRDVLESHQIPTEAEYVRQKQLERLMEMEDLTISYDGGTSTGREAFWTVCISTPNGEVYLVKVSEATAESHDAKFIVELVRPVCFILADQVFMCSNLMR